MSQWSRRVYVGAGIYTEYVLELNSDSVPVEPELDTGSVPVE
jgi:hypothetical protein